jgi:hypothetical protein
MKKIRISLLFLLFTSLLSCQEKENKRLVLLVSVNRSFEKINQIVDESNGFYYRGFDKCDKINIKFLPWKEKSQKLKKEAFELIQYIQKIKLEMIKEANGSTVSYENKISIVNYGNKMVVNKFMIEHGYGKLIKEKIQNYRRVCFELIENNPFKIPEGIINTTKLEVDEPYITDFGKLDRDDAVKCEKLVYKDLTLIESVLILTKLQADIRQSEVKVLMFIFSQVDFY